MARRKLRRGLLHLPWADRAYIPLTPLNKLKDYALDVEHGDGGSTAKWFRETLGFGPDDWENLYDQIIERVPFCWVCDYDFDSKWPRGSEWGVEIPIDGSNGLTREIHTGWFIPYREAALRPNLSTLRPCGIVEWERRSPPDWGASEDS